MTMAYEGGAMIKSRRNSWRQPLVLILLRILTREEDALGAGRCLHTR
jgi:hypothetical protein